MDYEPDEVDVKVTVCFTAPYTSKSLTFSVYNIMSN